jgi:hypothetical protein
MPNWFDKTNEEIIQRLKNVLRPDNFKFLGKFVKEEETDYGFFTDVRSLSGVKQYYPTNEGEYDSLNNRPLNIYSKVKIFDKVEGKLKTIVLENGRWYNFIAIPALMELRRKHSNPFLLQVDYTKAKEISNLKEKELIDNIKNDAIDTPVGIALKLKNALETISFDINTSPTTFIFELIQNADDYPNTENNVVITFQLKDSYLVVKHNGCPFEVNNTVALCGINEGDKREDKNKIGFKGIGFKAIFKDSNWVYIKSGNYSFRFDENYWKGQGIPMFWHITPIATSVADFKHVIGKESNVNITIKPKEFEILKNYKNTFIKHFNDERILLFLRNVKSLIFDSAEDKFEISNLSSKWKIFKEDNVEIPEEETNELNRRINFPDKRIPVKFHDITSTELGFGFRINQNKVESISESYIYAYLPTKVNLGFSFILNGNFIPDASRTNIYSDLTWNSFLFEKAGELFIKQITLLLNSGLEKESVLNQIPNFPEILLNIKDDDKIVFINCFKKGFEKNILTEKFIPTQSDSLETLSNILIDETGLANLLKEQFSILTGIKGKLIHNEVGEGEENIKTLIKEYEQGTIYNIENLKAALKTEVFKEWLKLPINNFQIIQYLHINENLKSLLETENIILSERKDLFKSPSLFKSIPNELTFILTEKISSDLSSLLSENNVSLKLAEFEPIKFFKDNILGKQNSINSALTDEANLLNFWKFIFNNWGVFESDTAIKDSLKHFEVLCKPTTGNAFSKKVISSAYLSDEYNPANDIESVVKKISPEALFISDKYIGKEREAEKWKKIFKQATAITDLQKVIEILIDNLPAIAEDSEHFEIAKQIFKFWKDNKDNTNKLSDLQIALVKAHLKIKCVDKEFRKAIDCFISDHYNNNQLISSWIPNIELANQIAEEYAPRINQVPEWKNFFTLIDCVELADKQNVLDAKLDFFITSQDELREKHFKLLKSISDLHKDKKENGLKFDFENVLSQIELQASNGEWYLPNEIHLSNSYTPKLKLQNDDTINSTFLFLSDKYIPTEIQKYFLTDIGVNDGFYFKKIIPVIQIDKVQQHKFVSQLESIEKYRLRVQEIRRMTSKDARGNSVRTYQDEKIRLNTYVTNHQLINYPQLLFIPKYSESFLKFVIKNKEIDTLATETEIKIWNKIVYKHPNYITWLLQTHSLLANQEDVFVKPTEMFSFNLSNYIASEAELPKINYSTQIAENGKTLEEILGIKQMLTISHCIELLCRKENRISYEEITQLQIVEILSDYSVNDEEKKKLFLLNSKIEWKPISELFISKDSEFPLEPSQNLHEDFHSIADNFGIQELSTENLVLKTKPKTPTLTDEIVLFLSNKAKFIAFKIDHLNYEVIESDIKEKISDLEFYEVRSITKVFPEDNPIYKSEEFNFHFNDDENKILYKGNWKTNISVISFLFEKLQHDKIEKLWFENLINRWDDDKIIEKLNEEVGTTPREWDSSPQSANSDGTSNREKTDTFWTSLNIDDENFIRGIIKGDYELNEKLDANTTAKIKTLMEIRDIYESIEISDDGRFLKADSDEILVRSAQRGLLRLDLYSWDRLGVENVKLSLYTDSCIKIFNTQEDLIAFTKPQNRFGILRMPDDYSIDDFNSLENINDKGKWHFVFIVNENTKTAQNYKEFINLDDYNF